VGDEDYTGATIGLLALVVAGLAVFGYTKHREVAYLTLRADHLERRINELESELSIVNKAHEETGQDPESVIYPPTSQEKPSWALSIEETNAWRRERGLPPLEPVTTLEHLRSSSEQSTSTPTPIPEPVVYTYEELYESREEGPNRPECEPLRQLEARGYSVRPWWYTNFLAAFNCATVEDRLNELERGQR
jgi:phosphopantetheine adenylyltransferase